MSYLTAGGKVSFLAKSDNNNKGVWKPHVSFFFLLLGIINQKNASGEKSRDTENNKG